MRSIRQHWKLSTLGRAASVLDSLDRRKMYFVTLIQILLSLLDLLGVVLIGVLGALAVSGVQSLHPGTRVGYVLTFFHITHFSFTQQIAFIGAIAVTSLVGRTIFSIIFTRKILFFLSRRGAKISANLVSRLLSQPMLLVQKLTSQETLYSVTNGVEVITLNILAVAVSLVSDFASLVILLIGLFVVDPIISIGTLLVFGVIGTVLYFFMHVRARIIGLRSSELRIRSNEKIIEVFSSYRESVVRNRRDFYAREIGRMRFDLADVLAEGSFMPYVGKYVIETTVVLGAVLLGAAQFILQDATHAVGTLAVFLAAGSRIAPAVLRLQQGAVTIRSNSGAANVTLEMIENLSEVKHLPNVDDTVDIIHEGFDASVNMASVSFKYSGRDESAISDVSLRIPAGASVAIVGPSGSGKTTLIDNLLGVIDPDEGHVSISGQCPNEAISRWPGAIAYVSQDVVISNGTIRENVALGYPIEVATEELVLRALEVAHLDQFVSELPFGIDTPVGERGTQISGGQRQRLGIARAMFTRPHLLVLDEATSSLDGETEAAISSAIHALRGSTTVVMIAHRLSTVREADVVVYLDRGKVIATGSFTEVRNRVPDFDRQAKLMGI
ncbi:unannotated protein [freshwater metagenome]|uniref:Unannotated protein n=1 Tax=freshwater metagenome TaxID=449393 RepID=A0A6J7CH42_9ZZZZ|nr:ATP-binding cassette domain-containing protein [Actinomycetota bacterium]MSW25695.1 ATP-binding cassette domain-containing protein [Actinomycetota bacterium]MSW33427.1 ATP-binding cassette domain-containing protein [Actinomycetota bacterium]MSX30451.1 ATP-binding cassette domain-containing protein [Actinomycetota bacterium]MSX51317.1 ATP-binding cassette domain-containing protein [Actinomycetota bacterium]